MVWFVFIPKIPILVKFWMENVVIFYDHLEYFTALWKIYGLLIHIVLWSFGIFLRFGIFGPRKIWQPCFRQFEDDLFSLFRMRRESRARFIEHKTLS
jgi:hypothetical protein